MGSACQATEQALLNRRMFMVSSERDEELLMNGLIRYAFQTQAGGSAKTFVVVDNDRIVGHYSECDRSGTDFFYENNMPFKQLKNLFDIASHLHDLPRHGNSRICLDQYLTGAVIKFVDLEANTER